MEMLIMFYMGFVLMILQKGQNNINYNIKQLNKPSTKRIHRKRNRRKRFKGVI